MSGFRRPVIQVPLDENGKPIPTHISGPKGDPGRDGRDGLDGKNGIDGKDGRDGLDGKDGIDGKDGRDGIDGKDGADGKDGKDGISVVGDPGRPGHDGRDGIDGKDGCDGKDGVDGKDGKDGSDGKDGIGIKGDPGKDGKDGRNGLDGKDGAPGPVSRLPQPGATVISGAGNTASGQRGVVAGGAMNTATGRDAAVLGGNHNTASGVSAAVGGGQQNVADGDCSVIPGGAFGDVRGAHGKMVFSSGKVGQIGWQVLSGVTNGAEAVRLTSDGGAANAVNSVPIPDNSVFLVTATVMNSARWFRADGGVLARGEGADTTEWTGAIYEADTTLGCLNVTVTGTEGQTIRWVCRVETTEV